mmetsp:Transcript_2751/g.7758  ORF Transcript_2751/g.7758 Transcript_2751/m.7758 type:complete len:203 (+) Transcript_2751:600-1208(+)
MHTTQVSLERGALLCERLCSDNSLHPNEWHSRWCACICATGFIIGVQQPVILQRLRDLWGPEENLLLFYPFRNSEEAHASRLRGFLKLLYHPLAELRLQVPGLNVELWWISGRVAGRQTRSQDNAGRRRLSGEPNLAAPLRDPHCAVLAIYRCQGVELLLLLLHIVCILVLIHGANCLRQDELRWMPPGWKCRAEVLPGADR